MSPQYAREVFAYLEDSELENPPQPGWVNWIPARYSSSRGGRTVDTIIYHYTAGSALNNTVRWFRSEESRVSAHYVIGRDGSVVQMVDLDRKAWHAGNWNARSVGIEIVNFGPLLQKDGKYFLRRRGRDGRSRDIPYPAGRPAPIRVGDRYWEGYTEQQYHSLIRLTHFLLSRFPLVRAITGHQSVSTRGKTDPGPAFDWERIRRSLPSFAGHVGPLGTGAARPAPALPGTAANSAAAGASWERAVRLNDNYGRRLRWLDRVDDIVRLLGFTDQSPDPVRFAQALAAWQRSQGLTDDGILGPRTWERMQPMLASATAPVSSGQVGRLGTLLFRRNGQPVFRYGFTREDLLWTARLISGEAGARDDLENRAVIAAMLNRYALFTRRNYSTFNQFIRAYSTPLQPMLRNVNVAKHYMNDSRFVRLGGTYPGTSVPRGQLRRHIELQRTPWERLRPVARKIALEALTGNMPDTGIGLASEFASTWILYGRRVGNRNRTEHGWLEFTRNFKRTSGLRWIGQMPRLNQKRNAFFTQRAARSLPADSVQVIPSN